MLKEEFKKLTGHDITDNEFEMVNAIYMLSDNESKQDFAMRFAKFNKMDMLAACAQVLDGYRRKNTLQWNEINALKKLLMDIAVWIRKGEDKKALECIKNCMGRKMFIVGLWREKVPLTKTDIDTLVDIVLKTELD